jgi:DNA-binding GntR family transcriptional regulator
MTPGEIPEPLHARIAAALRRDIADGTLAPGDRVPSELALAEKWSTARPTVREALNALRTAGLITTVPGRGTFVREKPAMTLRSAKHSRRSKTGESTSPFARDAQREGRVPNWVWDTAQVRADERIAGRLGIAAGDKVMRTAYVFSADGRPVQTSTSWEPFAIVGGTPVEEPEGEGRIIGVIARMDSIDIRVDRVVELVHARPAEEDERRVLDIPDDVWVQLIERTHWAGERAVETCDIVIPADRYLLQYEIFVD